MLEIPKSTKHGACVLVESDNKPTNSQLSAYSMTAVGIWEERKKGRQARVPAWGAGALGFHEK